MNIEQADKIILSGEWAGLIEDIIEAMQRYQKNGPVLKDSLIYDMWTQRIEYLQDAIEV
jgi:hypothetical protein